MNLQNILNNAVAAKRAQQMLNSEQLTIEELLLRLKAVTNKDLPVVFDDGTYKPTGIDSWRGSYAEPAFGYSEVGEKERAGSYNGKLIKEHKSEYGNWAEYEDVDSGLPTPPPVSDVIELLERVKGKTFTGYKGGDFTYGKTSPLWVANYGTSGGFKQDKEFGSQAVIDVVETEKAVSIVTDTIQY